MKDILYKSMSANYVKQDLKVVKYYLEKGRIDAARVVLDRIYRCTREVATGCSTESSQGWEDVASAVNRLKCKISVWKGKGWSDEKISEEASKRIGDLGVEESFETGSDITWRSTAERLSEEVKMLEEQIESEQQEFMELYDKTQEEA